MKWQHVLTGLVLAAVCGLTTIASAHPPLPVGCSPATRPGCAYSPALTFATTAVFDTVLTDASRNNYQLPVRVRYPVGAVGPLPVIIYNHGGSASNNAGFRANSQPWPTLWAEHGYVVINPTRRPLASVTVSQTAECALNAVPPAGCANFFGQMIYGPQNTDYLIDQLPQLAALHPPLSGLMDSEKVMVAGWSGGSTVVLANAGATRQFTTGGPVYDQKTDRPIGFFGIATMGPDYAGFDGGFDSLSYDLIDERPFITMSGKGDTNGKPSEARTTAWRRSTAGSKYLSFGIPLATTHGAVNLSDCNSAVQILLCDWMKSAGLAYVDAVTRNRAAAKAWLASDAYQTLTAGNIEFHRR